MRQVWSFLLVCLSASLYTPAQAQSIPSPFEYIEKKYSVGLYGGYIATDTGTRDAGPESAPLLGARYGMQLSGPLSFEIALAFSPSNRTIYFRPVASDPALAPAGRAKVGLAIAEAGFRFHLTGPRTWHGFAPYILANIGGIADIASKSNVEDTIAEDQLFKFGPAFAAGGGGGIDFFLTDWLSVRAEAKDHLWRYSYPIGLSDSGEEESQWVHNLGLSFGAAIHF